MGTVFDYLDWRGDLTFEKCDVTEVDALIMSLVSYLDLYRIVPASPSAGGATFLAAIKKYVNTHKGEALGLITPYETVSLATRAARTERYGCNVRMVGYVNEISDDIQMQFSATTYLIREDACFIAFRGTDDTIIGWKEDLNMSFMYPIPAQTRALAYLSEVAAAHPKRRIYVGGHSKGGNLAVYSAVRCDMQIKSRIEAVYNLDGPGFTLDFIQSEEYLEVRERIHTLVPRSSIIGMLLEHEESYEVMQSRSSGLLQHNGFSWEVMGGSFVHTDSVTEQSKRIDRTIKEWLAEKTSEERQQILDTLYEILDSIGAKTLTDLSAEKLKLIKAWNNLDSESRAYIKRCLRLIIKESK